MQLWLGLEIHNVYRSRSQSRQILPYVSGLNILGQDKFRNKTSRDLEVNVNVHGNNSIDRGVFVTLDLNMRKYS